MTRVGLLASSGQSIVEGLAMGIDAVASAGGIAGCQQIDNTAYEPSPARIPPAGQTPD